MRYDRVEDCPNGIDDRQGDVLHTWCGGNCHNGEIHTPVEHIEMWIVVSPEGDHAKVHVGVPAIRYSRQSAWSCMIDARRHRGEFGMDTQERLVRQGYTCEQIHVIRKEPNE